MQQKNLTEIVTIIDSSGSMNSLKSKTIEGFNEFLNDQKQLEDKANLSLILFSSPNREKIVFDSVNIKEVNELTNENYSPNGTTALYDAIGKSIKALKKRIKNLDDNEKPNKIIFVILTDGEENSSTLYTKNDIFKMITKMENKGWTFIYLGSNQDAFQEGSKIGIKSNRSMTYKASEDGINFAYTSISDYVKTYRSSVSVDDANNLNFDNINANTD